MGIFLRHSYNIPPPRWGSPADVQYAIKTNLEKIHGVSFNNCIFSMPLFWGLPTLDYTGLSQNIHSGSWPIYKKRDLFFYTPAYNHIQLGSQVLSSLSEGTVSFKFIAHSFNSASVIYKQGSGFNNFNASIPASAGSTLVFHIGSNTVRPSIKSSWNLYQLYQVTVTWNDEINIYIDGVLDNTIAVSVATAGPVGFATQLGRYYFAPTSHGGYLTGYLPDVTFFNRELSADQVLSSHESLWALYQKVSRPFYLLPTVAPTGNAMWYYNMLKRRNA